MIKTLKLFHTIQKELKAFEVLFDDYLAGLEFSEYLSGIKGKMLRPALVILGANIAGKTTKNTLWTAVAVEMMHNATLIHDDVVDDANKRRYQPTFRSVFGDKKAVLYGDYLFAKSLECVAKVGNIKIINTVAKTTDEMSIGEIRQLDTVGTFSTNEEEYFDIIYKKTASLFVGSLLIGYYSTAQDFSQENLVRRIGADLGMAFQIKDDLLDYDAKSQSGKSYGNDIRERKMTLPLIFALKQADENKCLEVKKMFSLPEISGAEVIKIINFVNDNDGIAYTESILMTYLERAQKALEDLPKGLSKDALKHFCDYLLDRKA